MPESKKCIRCGSEKSDSWIIITSVEKDGLRLFEKPKPYRYESFSIPEKQTIYFCSPLCAREYLIASMEMFIAEAQPERKKTDAFKKLTT